MRLNHMEIAVADAEAAALFFQRHFGFRDVAPGGPGWRVMADTSGFVLVLNRQDDCAYPEGFHIGFLQTERAAVDLAYQRLRDAGAEIVHPLSDTAGAWLFLCRVPGSLINLEVSWRPTRR